MSFYSKTCLIKPFQINFYIPNWYLVGKLSFFARRHFDDKSFFFIFFRKLFHLWAQSDQKLEQKVAQMFKKVTKKKAQHFYLKSNVLKVAQIVTQHLEHSCEKIGHQELEKIAQFEHTVCG